MIRWFAPVLLALGLVAPSTAAPGSAPKPTQAEHADLPADLPADGASLFELAIALQDQNGHALRLEDFRGHALVISMFYGTCPYACPMLISEIKKIERKLDPATLSETRVLLVSFDPERDTENALRELVSRHQVDGTRWHLARASDPDVRTLAAVLGIRYKKLANGAFNHSSVITILDANGVPRFREDGLGDPPDAAATALASLRRG